MVKIGIISDIHANIYGLRSVLNKVRDTDLIICAGDITGYYPYVNEVFEELNKHNIRYVKGNHDEYLLTTETKDLGLLKNKSVEYTRGQITGINLTKLKSMPKQLNLVADGYKIAMYHGSPWDCLNEYIYPDYKHFKRFEYLKPDIIVMGHTHFPFLKKIGGKLLINPGSCGQPRDYDPRASYARIDTSLKVAEIFKVEYERSNLIQKIEELGFDISLIKILELTKAGVGSLNENKIYFG